MVVRWPIPSVMLRYISLDEYSLELLIRTPYLVG